MTSSEPMNETTKNFLQAIREYKEPPPPPKPIIKLTYDPDTKYVTGYTFEDTTEPYVEITYEQWKSGFYYQSLQVVDGKPVRIERNRKAQLALVPGSRWFTDQSNMLIMGKDKGWQRR